jgi:glutamine amidotransferase
VASGSGQLIVVDYGVNNVGSVVNMLRRTGAPVKASRDPGELEAASAIVLPGIGAFDHGMQNLDRGGFTPVLQRRVGVDKIPLLGICLGMQLLTRGSDEGERPGLGLISADTRRLRPAQDSLRIPHMGWNDTTCLDDVLFSGLFGEEARFYFVHSYHVVCDAPSDVAATCDYGGAFVAAIRHGHIAGTQFHPEKSHRFGKLVLENFAKWALHA